MSRAPWSTALANRPHHLFDLRFFAVDRGIGAKQWPFHGARPMPDDESAVPDELVPGAAALVPRAPPVAAIWCDPMPPPRPNAAVAERLTQRATQRTESFFMPRLLRTRDQRDGWSPMRMHLM
jgi:hypothetical protein